MSVPPGTVLRGMLGFGLGACTAFLVALAAPRRRPPGTAPAARRPRPSHHRDSPRTPSLGTRELNLSALDPGVQEGSIRR